MKDNKIQWNRRQFLDFLGRGSMIAAASPLVGMNIACTTTKNQVLGAFPIKGVAPDTNDDISLSEGLDYKVLVKWGEAINDKETFGFNCDFTQYIPLDGKKDEGILWVNHEYTSQTFVSQVAPDTPKTKEQVIKEMQSVGGSLIRIKKTDSQWKLVPNDEYNRRLDGLSEIPIISERPIVGSTTAIGTFANCSGGLTPWGNILTCEENYDMFYGERDFSTGAPRAIAYNSYYKWENFFDHPPEHYGWVVEVNPLTGEAKKLTGLGRCAHECATVFQAADGRCVVYTGDDANDECLYKFIADEVGSLEKGKLYVANIESGKWLSLNYDDQAILREKFKDQTEILIRAREAAKLVGGTPLDRPEDIEIDPNTKAVIVALTNNKPKGRYFGHLLKLVEKDNDPLSMEFESSTFLAGGEELGFACPDNLAFDPKGNLWFTTDISGSSVGVDPYIPFGNNSLFVVPSKGKNAGLPIRVATAPVDAEFTGPCFSPDGKTLFLSIQHPGEQSTGLDNLTSHWPDGGDSIPAPSVVAIQGKALDELMKWG